MKKRITHIRPLFAGIVAMVGTLACLPAHALVISQVYGGGGNSGALYTNDFIEIFNDSAITVNLSGFSVQYSSATGSTWQTTGLTGSLAPYQYYLIQEALGSGGSISLPTPDAVGSIAMSATSGKVALLGAIAALSGACPGTTPSLPSLDLVG